MLPASHSVEEGLVVHMYPFLVVVVGLVLK